MTNYCYLLDCGAEILHLYLGNGRRNHDQHVDKRNREAQSLRLRHPKSRFLGLLQAQPKRSSEKDNRLRTEGL